MQHLLKLTLTPGGKSILPTNVSQSYSQVFQGREIREYPLRQGGQGVVAKRSFAGIKETREAEQRRYVSHESRLGIVGYHLPGMGS